MDNNIKASGYIQWKGTDVCFDLNCKCGKLSHFDGYFMYYIKCGYCGTIYHVSSSPTLIEDKPPEKDFILIQTSQID